MKKVEKMIKKKLDEGWEEADRLYLELCEQLGFEPSPYLDVKWPKIKKKKKKNIDKFFHIKKTKFALFTSLAFVLTIGCTAAVTALCIGLKDEYKSQVGLKLTKEEEDFVSGNFVYFEVKPFLINNSIINVNLFRGTKASSHTGGYFFIVRLEKPTDARIDFVSNEFSTYFLTTECTYNIIDPNDDLSGSMTMTIAHAEKTTSITFSL